MSPYMIPVLALSIPILVLIARGVRRWHQIDIEVAQSEVDLRRRFRALDDIDRRVAGIERYVTSPEFGLHRQFRDLERPSS